MVAAAENKPAKAARIPIGTKLKARNLYLIHGLPHAEIAAQTGLSLQSIRNLAFNEGWTKAKAKRTEAMIRRADARMEAKVEEINEAIASECEEIALNGLKRAKEESESRGEFAARNFQSWTGGVSNLVKVQRLTRGLDGEQQQGATNVSLSLFCVQASPAAPQQAAERQEKRVEPLSIEAKALPI